MDFIYKRWGDLASLLGLALTIWFAWRAKSASEQARDAARQAGERIFTLDTVAALAAALVTLEEIKALNRVRQWDLVVVRYGTLRRMLVAIQSGLAKTQRDEIEKAIGHFRIMEGKLERAIARRDFGQIDAARHNRVVADQIDRLILIMNSIKSGAK